VQTALLRQLIPSCSRGQPQLSFSRHMRPFRIISVAVIGLALVPLLAAEDSAQIFVYLPWDSLQHSRLKISFDDVYVADVQPGRFFVINTNPGQHVLVADEGIPAVVEAHAERKCFVRVARQIEFGPSGKTDIPALEVVPSEDAHRDIVNLVYVNPKKIFSTAVSKEDPFLHQRPKLKTRVAPPQ
jgi:hypothetical protein